MLATSSYVAGPSVESSVDSSLLLFASEDSRLVNESLTVCEPICSYLVERRTSTRHIGHIDHGKTTLTAAMTKVLQDKAEEVNPF